MKQPAEYAGTDGRGGSLAVFSCTFALSYFVFWGMNIALFSYYPQINVWVWGSAKATEGSGPPMLFWGWMAYAALVGITVTLIAQMLPTSWGAWSYRRLNGLIVGIPLVVIAGIIYLSRDWF